MFTDSFSANSTVEGQYVYQTVITPNPIDGSPVCSLLLLEMYHEVAIKSTFLYDVSRDAAQAEAYRNLLVKGEVLPHQAADILDEWLGEDIPLF